MSLLSGSILMQTFKEGIDDEDNEAQKDYRNHSSNLFIPFFQLSASITFFALIYYCIIAVILLDEGNRNLRSIDALV